MLFKDFAQSRGAKLYWQRVTTVLCSFAGRTCKNRKKWYTQSLNYYVIFLHYVYIIHTQFSDPSGWVVYGESPRPIACWGCGFESGQMDECLFLVRVMCCHADPSSRGVLPTVVSLYVIQKPQEWGGSGSRRSYDFQMRPQAASHNHAGCGLESHGSTGNGTNHCNTKLHSAH
jgi:hypothetical protein